MKFNALEYFITLAESKSINEAARKLFISQPSLTKALHLLEEEIGTELFQRSSAGITLTPAGRKMLPEAKQVMEYYRGWKKLNQVAVLEQIDIFSYVSFPDFLIPDLILQFNMMHPDVTINYSTTASPENHISRSIHHPVISLVVCGSGECSSSLIKQQGNEPLVLMNGEYRCLVNIDSPLAKKDCIRSEDLHGYYFITPNLRSSEQSGFVHRIIQDISSSNPAHKIICMETVNNVISAVNRNPDVFALAYYPALKRYTGENLVAVPFEGMQTKCKICVFYSKEAYNLYPVMQEFIQALQKAAEAFLSNFVMD